MYFRPGQTDTTKEEAYYLAGIIVLCVLVPVITIHPFILYVFEVGMKIRLGCCAMIYQKALRITTSMAIDGLDGQVINLMANDAAKFDSCVSFVHDLWKGPLELLILGYFIYREVNICGLLGLAFMLLFIPLQGECKLNSALCLSILIRSLLHLVLQSVCPRLDGSKSCALSPENGQADGQTNAIHERDYPRHPGDQNVHLGEVLCENRGRHSTKGN